MTALGNYYVQRIQVQEPIVCLERSVSTLATQLMDSIESLIHPDQAGLIPKRSIFNQTRLAQTIIDYAEAVQEDGAIVALDQEKAYDKVKHDYLWTTLEKFNLPQIFIRTVKSLYQDAHTQVAINRIFSQPYQVTVIGRVYRRRAGSPCVTQRC